MTFTGIASVALLPSQTGRGIPSNGSKPLLVSTHRNFRPVDVRSGPDGAIYICDWYNSVICHQDDPFRHPDRDFTHGRIWRVSNTRAEPVQRPELRRATVRELYEHLNSPERWIRYQAKRVLASSDAQREPEHVAGSLAARFTSSLAHQQDEHLLLEIIGVLESLEEVNEELLGHLVVAGEYRARAYAARVVGRWSDRLQQPLKLLTRLVQDPHPLVRMEAIVASAHVSSPHAAEVAAIATDYEIDYDIDYALSQALHHLKRLWIPAFQRGELTFGGQPHRVAEVLKRVRSDELITTLRQMAAKDSPSQLTALKTLAMVGDAEDLNLVLDAACTHAAVAHELLEALEQAHRATGRKPDDPAKQLTELFASGRPSVQADAIRLAGLWRVRSLAEPIADFATATLKWDVRQSALSALGQMGGDASRHRIVAVCSGRRPASTSRGNCIPK